MPDFPDTLHFSGLNAPVRQEVSIKNLDVEGEIPAEIEGAFFRAVPDPAHAPLDPDDIILSGDGMVSRFLFQDGHVDYAIRYVRTARFQAEDAARHALFGKYRNPYTDDPSVKGIDRTVANTTPIWHAGRLLMTKEDGRAYEVDPHTLETIGQWDFGGRLRSETMTAHARIDAQTGEMFFFGYEAGGLCSLDVAYCIADADGDLVSEQWFEQPYCSSIHDFAITEHHAIFPVFPTTVDDERLRNGGDHWVHEQDRESWVGIMPRYGRVSEMRWFRGPKGVSAYHIVNAFSDGDLVHMDVCLSDTNAFPFIRASSGLDIPQWEVGGGLIRWTFDLSRPGEDFEQRHIGPPGDLPRVRDADQGRPYRAAWYLSVNPDGPPPLPGGPVGATFNTLLRIEPGNGRLEALPLEPGMALNEPAFVPARDPDHEGWLLTVVDRAEGDDFRSELWIIDAGAVAKGPVARVKVPVRLRPQVHGTWVPADQLAHAKASLQAA